MRWPTRGGIRGSSRTTWGTRTCSIRCATPARPPHGLKACGGRRRVMYELIAQGLTLVLVIYFGLHLRQKIQTLQTTVAFQKDTIDALVKHQGDVDALNRTMKQTVDALQALVA